MHLQGIAYWVAAVFLKKINLKKIYLYYRVRVRVVDIASLLFIIKLIFIKLAVFFLVLLP